MSQYNFKQKESRDIKKTVRFVVSEFDKLTRYPKAKPQIIEAILKQLKPSIDEDFKNIANLFKGNEDWLTDKDRLAIQKKYFKSELPRPKGRGFLHHRRQRSTAGAGL